MTDSGVGTPNDWNDNKSEGMMQGQGHARSLPLVGRRFNITSGAGFTLINM
jgi:hypothetical protein